MRAVVTGAQGFAGRHLCAHLAEAGDEVTALGREVDVTDRATLERALAPLAPDVLYHLAARTHVGASWREPAAFTRANVVGTAAVLAVAERLAPAATVLVVSSADVYGLVPEDELPARESRRLGPLTPYARSKVEAERLAREAAARGLRVVVVRPFSHTGPGQSLDFVVPALAARLLEARERGVLEVPVGDLTPRRDLSDVRDVVRAYRLAATLGTTGATYNVASGRDVAVADVASWLAEQILPAARFVRHEDLVRPVEVPVVRGDVTRLHEATGWEPRIDLVATLHDVVADVAARRALGRAGDDPLA